MEWISDGNKRYSTGNLVSGVVIALYADSWYLHLWGAQHNTELLDHYVVRLK